MRLRIFSVKQIQFTALFTGSLPTAYLISANYSHIAQKKGTQTNVFLGYIFTLLGFTTAVFLIDLIAAKTGLFRTNRELAYTLSVPFFMLIQAAFAWLLLRINKKRINKISRLLAEKATRYTHYRVIPYMLISILPTIYLFTQGPQRFLFLIIYLLPNIYLLGRIQNAFVTKTSKWMFRTVFLLLVAIFPVVMSVREAGGIILQYTKLLSYYYLAVMLYIFLLYLIADIVLLLNKKLKFIGSLTLSSTNFNKTLLALVMLLTVIIVVKGVFNYNNTYIKQYSIQVAPKATGLKKLKVAMAADIHFSEYTNKQFVRQFVEKINSIKPDIVLFAGDIVESTKLEGRTKFFTEELSKLHAKYGVYTIEGNHDLYNDRFPQDFFKDANIQLLRDTVVCIDNSFFIIGRKDRHDRDRKSLEELLVNAADSLPRILLDHQPYLLETAYSNGIDMQMSGHTHNGQLFPFNYITQNVFELSWGYRKINGTQFFVTCGAQGWGPPVKTAGRSEIMQINIEFSEH